MATVMLSRDGKRHCDSICHDATGPECDCICGGRYHGKGGTVIPDLIRDLRAGELRDDGLEGFVVRAMKKPASRRLLTSEQRRQEREAVR